MARPVQTPDYTVERPTHLMNRHFFLLWQGQFVSLLGGYINTVALASLVKQATGSASIIGLIMLVASVTRVLLSGIGGTLADRHSRRKIIIYSDLVRGIAVLALAGLLYTVPHATGLIVMGIWGAAVCIAATGAFFAPAMAAATPDLVPQDKVTQANSLRQISAQLAMFVGQSLGGILFRLWGAPLLVLINGVSFLYSALSEYFVIIPQIIPHQSSTWREQFNVYKQEMIKGFLYSWRLQSLKRLFIVSALLNIFGAPLIILLPFYVEDYLQVTLDWYGFLLAIYSVGSLLGALAAGFIKLNGAARREVMLSCMVLHGVSIILLGISKNPITSLLFACLIGMLSGFNSTNIVSILQISIPSEMRGRVFGLLNTLAGSTVPLGMGLGGVMFDMTGQSIPLVYGSCGGIIAVLSLLVAMDREFRQFLAYEPAPNRA